MDKESPTIEIIKLLINAQNIKHEPNVKDKLNEFMLSYMRSILTDAKKYSNHAGRDTVNEQDVKLATEYKRERQNKLKQKDLEEAAFFASKNQFKDLRDTSTIILGDLEGFKPVKHLVTKEDVEQLKKNVNFPNDLDLELIYKSFDKSNFEN